MLDASLLALLGFCVGAFGTLVGAGGGFILVPILLFLYPDRPPETITAMSLVMVFGNAVSGTIAYARQRRVDYWSGIRFAIATLPGAVAGAYVVQFIPRSTFNLVFASVLGVLGLYLLLSRGVATIRKPLHGWGVVHRQVTDSRGDTFLYAYRFPYGMGISAIVGFISSLLGIGGGIVHVPMMAVVLQFPVHIATATSQFVLGLMAVEAVATHFVSGTLQWDQTLLEAGLLMVGAVVGAQLGARVAHYVRGETIIRVLGVALLLVSLRLAFAR
ncbi:MAG: sulfite exporter TauE/SafE family protein [Dehalococcoidia bacterium]